MGVSYYGIIFPEFWTGPTGRELRIHGGKEAQLLALYVATNRHANMLGLYHLLIDDVRHESGLSLRSIEKAYRSLAAASFAEFDAQSAFVWVRQMARFRLGLRNGAHLAPEDNRVVAVNRLYQTLAANPFLGPFYDLNRKLLCLKSKRLTSDLVVPFTADHYISPLARGS